MANEVPPRHLAITARVPTGPRCDGCQFYRPVVGTCSDNLMASGDGPWTWITVTNGIRLPACLARDEYLVVAPGSAEAELIEAAVYWASGNGVMIIGGYDGRRVAEAARRVAKERKG